MSSDEMNEGATIDQLVGQLQKETLDVTIPLQAVLLKAKVLSYKLKNDEFKKWVRSELDGYAGSADVPDYRVLPMSPKGHFVSRFRRYTNLPIPIISLPDWLQESATQFRVIDGIGAMQEQAKSDSGSTIEWPGDWIALLNTPERLAAGMECLYVSSFIPVFRFAQILDVVRSRLQDFLLELSDLPWNMAEAPPPADQIERLVQITILNSPQGGGAVTVFDQRGQKVTYQYNAAGNINIGAIQNRADFSHQLEQLRSEVAKARASQVLEEETALDVDYQLGKALLESNKPEPNRKPLLDHLAEAASLVKDIAAIAGQRNIGGGGADEHLGPGGEHAHALAAIGGEGQRQISS